MREPISRCETLAASGYKLRISPRQQRRRNLKNICGNLSHLWITPRFVNQRLGNSGLEDGSEGRKHFWILTVPTDPVTLFFMKPPMTCLVAIFSPAEMHVVGAAAEGGLLL